MGKLNRDKEEGRRKKGNDNNNNNYNLPLVVSSFGPV